MVPGCATVGSMRVSVGPAVLPFAAPTRVRRTLPTARYAALVDHAAVYPGLVDCCTVDGEVVRPQPGGFYGGWVTSKVVGPFKGQPGTQLW